MSDEEFEQQDKQEESKEEKKKLAKRDLKIIITSIVCMILFSYIVINLYYL